MIPLTEESAALDTLEGMVNSYVRGSRGRKRGVTLANVFGQVGRAKRSGAPEEEMRNRIRKAITDPPHSDPDRVREIMRLFLS